MFFILSLNLNHKLRYLWHLEDNHIRGRKFKICKEHFIERMGLMEEDIGMYMLSYHIFE